MYRLKLFGITNDCIFNYFFIYLLNNISLIRNDNSLSRYIIYLQRIATLNNNLHFSGIFHHYLHNSCHFLSYSHLVWCCYSHTSRGILFAVSLTAMTLSQNRDGRLFCFNIRHFNVFKRSKLFCESVPESCINLPEPFHNMLISINVVCKLLCIIFSSAESSI